MNKNKHGAAASRYEKLAALREPVLNRARQCAELTIPALFPPEDYDDYNGLNSANQSLGAKGVNNISSKLMLATLPPNSPFYKIGLNPDLIPPPTGDRETDNQTEKEQTEIENALARLEQSLLRDINSSEDRSTIAESFKHRIIGGNVLLHDDEEVGLRLFRLDNYVVVREYSGKPLEILTRELIPYESLDEDLKEIVDEASVDGHETDTDVEEFELFTWLKRDGELWDVHQEIQGSIVPSSIGHIRDDVFNYYPLRFYKEDGRDYSRSFVEDLYNDLVSYDSLTADIKDASREMARIIHLVRPNANVDTEDFEQAESGDVILASPEDVVPYQMNKFPDLQFTSAEKQQLKDDLTHSFLMNSAVQRDAERVTAHEIMYVAQELDGGLSGFYSLHDSEFQKPYLNRKIHLMKKKGRFPKQLTKNDIDLSIITGVEALGRNQELQKIDQFLAFPPNIPPELYIQNIDMNELIKRRETAVGLFGITKGATQVQEEQQQQMMQQMGQQLGPEIVKQVGNQVQGGSNNAA